MRAPVRCEFALSRSRRLLTLMAGSHVLTAALILPLVPSWQGAALAVAVLLHGMLQRLRRFGAGAAVVSAILHDEHGWALRFGAGTAASSPWCRAQLLAPVFCHRHLLVLRWRCRGRWLPVTVAVTDDSCSADDFRRLRVVARHLPAPQLWAASR